MVRPRAVAAVWNDIRSRPDARCPRGRLGVNPIITSIDPTRWASRADRLNRIASLSAYRADSRRPESRPPGGQSKREEIW